MLNTMYNMIHHSRKEVCFNDNTSIYYNVYIADDPLKALYSFTILVIERVTNRQATLLF